MAKPFITLYGINNLGKTTQAKLLVRRLEENGHPAELLKYPVYDIKPSGPFLDSVLRRGQKVNSPREMELWFAVNRQQAAPVLEEKLKSNIVVSEDYIGTGIAWGMAYGAELEWMETINSYLRVEDAAVLLDGERFTEAVEETHINETNSKLINKCRQAHLELAKRYNWSVVEANDSIETVHENIWQVVKDKLKLS
jgi:thymidylate kinase